MMPQERFDRTRLHILPLSERPNKIHIEQDHISPSAAAPALPAHIEQSILRLASDLRGAREAGASRMLSFGAHAIKNGLGPVLQWLIREKWITHLATNGAGIIHDWEFAYQGASSEDVRVNVSRGQFGIWEETGLYINLALIVGAYRGLGYGESVGALVEEEQLVIPSARVLESEIGRGVSQASSAGAERAAAASDLLYLLRRQGAKSGVMVIPHPFKQYSLQAEAYRLGVPFTAHPMFGHDIIYTHPANHGAAIGRTAERDFLSFAESVSGLSGGVYVSVGSAVMSPMIFEKSLSMCQNVALQEGRSISDHRIYVVDLAEAPWDWERDGEPPVDNPAYYLRFLKTFNRMGGTTEYLSVDNRSFLLGLVQLLRQNSPRWD
jgi:hypothetical protein